MIALTSRAAMVVRALLERPGSPVTIRELAARAHAGERSIRYDLDLIEAWLKLRKLRLCRKRRTGVWVEGSPGACDAALREIRSELGKKPLVVFGPEERRWMILAGALMSAAPRSVESFAQVLGTSKRTVYGDIVTLRSRLKKKGVDIVLRRGRMLLRGDETACRALLSDFLSWVEYGSRFLTRNGSKEHEPGSQPILQPLLSQIQDPEAAEKVRAILALARKEFKLNLTTNTIAALSAHILVTLARVKQGAVVRIPAEQVQRFKRRPEWSVAVWLGRAIREAFSVTLPEEELVSMALYLGPALTDGPGTPGLLALHLTEQEVGWCARAIVEEAEKELGIDLIHDLELRTGLVGHLYTSLEKARAGGVSRNPLLAEIKKRFPLVYGAARRAVSRLSELLGSDIPEDEAGWIAMHLGAALERLAQRHRAWNGVVVCASGLGVSRMLLARLSGEFPNAVLRPMAAFDEETLWKEVAKTGADLVISTVPLTPGPVPVVVVSPFLPATDLAKITSLLYSRRLPDEKELLRMAKVTQREGQDGKGAGPERSLADIVREDMMLLGADPSSPEEAIRTAGYILCDKGLASGSYVDAMVDLYRRFGAYFVILPGLAVPHAPAESGSLALGLSIVTLREPMDFGSPENDPVRLVMAMSCPHSPSSFHVVQELLGRVTPDIVRKMSECSSPDRIASILRSPELS